MSRAALSALCAGVLATGLAAQSSVQQRPPTFRGGAVLVTVDAYPQRDGKIVEHLTAADFEVFEDGTRQSLENVEFVRIEPSLSESARRDPNTQQESLQLAADPHNRVFVVFLDALHVTVEGSHDIRRPLVDTLNRIVAPNDLFGVMTQNIEPRHLTLGRRLLTVEEQLTKHWTWGERYRLGRDETDPMEETLERCFSVVPNSLLPWYVDDNGQKRLLSDLLIDRRREDRTLTSVEGLVEYLAGLREARTVALLVTDGWRLFQTDRGLLDVQGQKLGLPLPEVGVNPAGTLRINDKQNHLYQPAVCTTEFARLALLDSQQRLRDLIARANRANVSFYPVTPAGLAVFDTPISERSRPGLVEDGRRLQLRVGNLRTLAENTDGIAIVNTNDLGAGMRRIVDDVSAYYLLGYYSTNTNHDGKFRRIEVKVKTPGLKVRARRGYVAPNAALAAREPSPGVTADAPDASGLEEALAPLARLRTNADVFTRAAIDAGAARVVVELAAARAASVPWRDGADVTVVISGLDGRSLAPATGRILPGTRAVILDVPTTGAVPPLRVTTRVSAAGESFEDSFEKKDAPAAIVGEAVLFRGRPAATSPLRPVADLQFSRLERVHVEWSVSGDLDQRTARLLGRNGRPLAVPVSLTERETGGRRVLAADVLLAPLAAGDYLIELSVTRAAATQRTLVAFRVVQ